MEPPVAWKNEPCGRWSITVAPALVIAAAQTAFTPAARTVWANEADAMVAPACCGWVVAFPSLAAKW